jgi:hypothetical protein
MHSSADAQFYSCRAVEERRNNDKTETIVRRSSCFARRPPSVARRLAPPRGRSATQATRRARARTTAPPPSGSSAHECSHALLLCSSPPNSNAGRRKQVVVVVRSSLRATSQPALCVRRVLLGASPPGPAGCLMSLLSELKRENACNGRTAGQQGACLALSDKKPKLLEHVPEQTGQRVVTSSDARPAGPPGTQGRCTIPLLHHADHLSVSLRSRRAFVVLSSMTTLVGPRGPEHGMQAGFPPLASVLLAAAVERAVLVLVLAV